MDIDRSYTAIPVVILLMLMPGCHPPQRAIPVTSGPKTEVTAKTPIDKLRAFIMPPSGTTQREIQAIFGGPTRVTPTQFEGDPEDYPLHLHTLLGDPEKEAQPRAWLQLVYKERLLHQVRLWHACTHISRPYYREGTTERIQWDRHWAELKAQEHSELLEIRAKYGDALKRASWNSRGGKERSQQSLPADAEDGAAEG